MKSIKLILSLVFVSLHDSLRLSLSLTGSDFLRRATNSGGLQMSMDKNEELIKTNDSGSVIVKPEIKDIQPTKKDVKVEAKEIKVENTLDTPKKAVIETKKN